MDLNDPQHVLAALVVVITSIGVLAAILKRHLETLKPFKDLPMPDGSHWFHGHAEKYFNVDFQEGVKHLTTDFANEHGLSGNWLANEPVLCISNYKDARQILMTEYSRREPSLFVHHLRGFCGQRNFLIVNGKEWKAKRDAVTRTFDEDFMKASQVAMKQVTLTLVESLKTKLSNEGGSIQTDVQPLMKLITLDVFAMMAFGEDLKCCRELVPSKLAQSFDFILAEFARRMAGPLNPANLLYWMPTPLNMRHKHEKEMLFSFVNDLVEKQRRQKTQDNLMLSRLMHAQAHVLGKKSIEEVSSRVLFDDIMLLLFAGYDTTSITLMYALYLLSINPDIQELCAEETFNKSLEDPKELVYTKGVVQETLRMYPPGPQTTRTVSRDKTLESGFNVPKNTYVYVSIWSIHRNEKIFPQPLQFRPDRWVKLVDGTDSATANDSSQASKKWVERASMEEPKEEPGCTIAAANHKAFFPFSAGGRSCAGQKFALDEAIIVLATLVKHFQFKLADPTFKPDIQIRGILQMPKDGIPLTIEMRKKTNF
ncbi:Leukotriene-B(4) omega-hydroxylase 2 [Seminavis robusta]|uniref:Leukotriene-B(4) omega-hydroxylase 2 n=1 Tax=Seminavis robusta TaxID=568900 RepID=A0A9N8EQD1_9STRA|nr:Leukotriene-B(4) omega-hydroxylase 2 [Seminavis robusta]|eukprot:Sro1338_g264260.1 Leukotriene-B(4) omega-hydroxylase 2 (539) ;mRNA; f:26577-28282